jgi:hypothetical protein
MPALDFVEPIPDHLQKQVIGREDGAGQIKFNHRLGFIDGLKHAAQFEEFLIQLPGAGFVGAIVGFAGVDVTAVADVRKRGNI